VGRASRGGGAQEILKGGARGEKLFYLLKINKKTSIFLKILNGLKVKLGYLCSIYNILCVFFQGRRRKLKQNLEGGRKV
jgi:hypothetical protein